MSKKIKFKPIITRIKLNPEQAVLACSCYNTGIHFRGGGSNPNRAMCSPAFDPKTFHVQSDNVDASSAFS